MWCIHCNSAFLPQAPSHKIKSPLFSPPDDFPKGGSSNIFKCKVKTRFRELRLVEEDAFTMTIAEGVESNCKSYIRTVRKTRFYIRAVQMYISAGVSAKVFHRSGVSSTKSLNLVILEGSSMNHHLSQHHFCFSMIPIVKHLFRPITTIKMSPLF